MCATLRAARQLVSEISRIHTVEHVMSAVKPIRSITYALKLPSMEPPVGNGSSDVFVEMIEKAGIDEQEHTVPIVQDATTGLLVGRRNPSGRLPYDGYRISYTLNYPGISFLESQYHSFSLTKRILKMRLPLAGHFPSIKRSLF